MRLEAQLAGYVGSINMLLGLYQMFVIPAPTASSPFVTSIDRTV
jgi:hypothetical protein